MWFAASPRLRAPAQFPASTPESETGAARWRMKTWGETFTETCNGNTTLFLYFQMFLLTFFQNRLKPFKSLMCISSPLFSVTGEEYWTRAPKARGRLNPLAGTSLTIIEIDPPTSLMISTWLSLCARLPQVWLWRRGDRRSGAASQTEADKLRQEHTGLRPLPKRNPKVGSRTDS